MRAAEERGIPWLRLNDQTLVQLGHGKYQQRIQATVTSRTPHIAVEIATDKEVTNQILADLGLPVPRQRLVQQRATRRCARRSASAIPVVVKPLNGNHGRGIRSTSRPTKEVRAAFDDGARARRSVIVETFLAGDDHRMLVVNGELVAVAKRVPGHVVGDGEHTIAAAGRE